MMRINIKDGNQVKQVSLVPPTADQKVWIDGRNDDETVVQIADALGWDVAALTSITRNVDRAQLQNLGQVSFISVFVPDADTLRQVHILLAHSVLVTLHNEPVGMLDDIALELAQKADLLQSAHYLLYEILERTADRFLEAMDHYEEAFDVLEEEVLNGHDRTHAVFALRHELHRQRAILADMRRIAARLSRRQFASASTGAPEANIFVDVYDGFYHVMDNIDSLRDNLTGLVDLQLNQRSTRLNEIMKFLTIFSTIFLPLSFITGFLGMNLRSMPELYIPYGQEFTLFLMILLVATMLYVFKRRKWM